MRGRAYRRHKEQVAKRYATKVARRWWYPEEPPPRVIGYMTSTHCKPCSGIHGCGNPRKMEAYGQVCLTWQELRAAISEKEQRKECLILPKD